MQYPFSSYVQQQLMQSQMGAGAPLMMSVLQNYLMRNSFEVLRAQQQYQMQQAAQEQAYRQWLDAWVASGDITPETAQRMLESMKTQQETSGDPWAPIREQQQTGEMNANQQKSQQAQQDGVAAPDTGASESPEGDPSQGWGPAWEDLPNGD